MQAGQGDDLAGATVYVVREEAGRFTVQRGHEAGQLVRPVHISVGDHDL
jgi:hypothetical protein